MKSLAHSSVRPWDLLSPQLEAVTNCFESGVLVVDENHRIVYCSQPMAETFGLQAEDILAMTPDEFVTHIAGLVKDPPPVIRDRRLFAKDGRVICEEFEIAEPSRGIVRWVARRVNMPAPAQVVVCTDITTEVDLASAYERLAVTDLLTGLANRRGAEQQIRREISRARRHDSSLSFALFDIDHFKKVNDRFGHNVGDEVLRQVATAMITTLRESDLAARWGGEEFLIILPATPLEGARLAADRVRKSIEKQTFPSVGTVTVSGGVAELKNAEEVQHAIRRADEHLYEAKADGRNRVKF